MSGKNWRIIVTLILVVVAVFAFWNTFKLWTMSEEEQQQMQQEDPGALLELQQKAIRLGLDLQGGIHVVLRVKTEELDQGARQEAVDRAITVIRNRVDGLGVAEPTIQKQGDDRIIVDLPGYTDAERAEDLIGQTALLEFKLMASVEDANLVIEKIDSVVHQIEMERAGIEPGEETTGEPAEGEADTAMAEALSDTEEVQTDAEVLAELMGDTAIDTTELFGFEEDTTLGEQETPLSSRLQVALFSQRTNQAWPGFVVSKKDRELIDRWLSLPEVRNVIPIDLQFAWSTRPEIRDNREVYMLYVLKRKVQFLGKFLENIALGQDTYGKYAVDFRLSGDGAARFAQLTGANIDKPLAIVLDGKVESAPFINSKIRRSGQITMGSTARME
ncbi:hypothetical protein GF356_02390, partial [candidate division GN15 bacterium]|nr:hypothetical protein [candidate division GN15 bacterium]